MRDFMLSVRLALGLILVIILVGVILGVLIGSKERQEVKFTEELSSHYGELDDASHMDLLFYGLSVCTGYEDGWTRQELTSWLSRTPYEYLGSPGGDADEFGNYTVDLATELLCPDK